MASAKRGEQIDQRVLKSVLDHSDFSSIIPAQHLVGTIRVRFDKRNFGGGREESLEPYRELHQTKSQIQLLSFCEICVSKEAVKEYRVRTAEYSLIIVEVISKLGIEGEGSIAWAHGMASPHRRAVGADSTAAAS